MSWSFTGEGKRGGVVSPSGRFRPRILYTKTNTNYRTSGSDKIIYGSGDSLTVASTTAYDFLLFFIKARLYTSTGTTNFRNISCRAEWRKSGTREWASFTADTFTAPSGNSSTSSDVSDGGTQVICEWVTVAGQRIYSLSYSSAAGDITMATDSTLANSAPEVTELTILSG